MPAERPFEPIDASETLYDAPAGLWDDVPEDDTPVPPRREPPPGAAEARPGRPSGSQGGDADGDPRLALLQQLFPGRVVRREPLVQDDPDEGTELESGGHEHSETDAGSPESPGEDA